MLLKDSNLIVKTPAGLANGMIDYKYNAYVSETSYSYFWHLWQQQQRKTRKKEMQMWNSNRIDVTFMLIADDKTSECENEYQWAYFHIFLFLTGL